MKSFFTTRPPICLLFILQAFLLFINCSEARPRRDNNFPDPSTQLKTGEPDGIGPLAALSVHDSPMGRAFVYGGAAPDLFIRSGRWSNLAQGIYLYRYITRREGVPVFGEPVLVQSPPGTGEGACVIFQDADGATFGLWKAMDDFIAARYDKERLRFEPVDKKQLAEPCDLIWRKNGSGKMTRLEFSNHAPGLVAGSHYGVFPFYSFGPDLEPSGRRWVVGDDGVIVRNKTTTTSVMSYPAVEGANCDLIAIGEGGTYYYRFTGRFDDRDQPIYAGQKNLLEKGAPLWHSSLPVINTVDWDGDGDIDIISGDSVGFVCLLENAGNNADPKFLAPVKLRGGCEIIRMRPGYYGSLQGPGEANWGYSCPTVVDWNADGLPDIVLSGATATHTVYINRGTSDEPKLDSARELFCEGLDLHGPWRVKPGVGLLNGKMAYVIMDDDQQLHLYWRIDDQNLQDGGKLLLENGEPIWAQTRKNTGGKGGRAKITLFDWDRDGRNDMLITTHSGNSIPDPDHGIPRGTGAMVMLMLNVSTGEDIRFAPPRPLQYKCKTLRLGEHACSAAPYPFENGKYGMLVTIENGRFFLLPPEDISWGEPAAGRLPEGE